MNIVFEFILEMLYTNHFLRNLKLLCKRFNILKMEVKIIAKQFYFLMYFKDQNEDQIQYQYWIIKILKNIKLLKNIACQLSTSSGIYVKISCNIVIFYLGTVFYLFKYTYKLFEKESVFEKYGKYWVEHGF